MSSQLRQEPVLRLEEVSRRYGRAQALAPLSLELRAGEVLGLVGPNGAGKSTLMDIMGCTAPPSAGMVTVEGHRVTDLRSARQARRGIGYLPQHSALLTRFTARETLEYAAWLGEVPRDQRRSRAQACLEAVSLADRADTPVRKLSGGMAQRLTLATALVRRPRLLLLDEPTVGLDPVERDRFRKLLRSSAQMAVVISSHLIEDIAAVATRLLLLDQGRVRLEAETAALVRSPSTASADLEAAYLKVMGS